MTKTRKNALLNRFFYLADLLAAAAVAFVLPHQVFSQQEQLSITTYYPAPFGNYRELRTQRLAIGSKYSGHDYCWPPESCGQQINQNQSLAVDGNVGIGTAEPLAKLDVAGGVKIGFSDISSEGVLRYYVPPGSSTGIMQYCDGSTCKSFAEGVEVVADQTYTGDGASPRLINLGYRPKFLMVAGESLSAGPRITWGNVGVSAKVDESVGWDEIVLITDNGFQVKESANTSGKLYYYFVIK